MYQVSQIKTDYDLSTTFLLKYKIELRGKSWVYPYAFFTNFAASRTTELLKP